MVAQRLRGAGLMPRSSASTMLCGTSGPVQVGAPAIFCASSPSPVNGGVPANASHTETQNAYWSEASLNGSPRCCSGDM